ncbi:MAG: ATP-dependent DNA helicase RecG [Gammaproteobacteria bacterium]|nr:ATP-dependent DNA helicase RecG [Gammaproteobacteria bacterium]
MIKPHTDVPVAESADLQSQPATQLRGVGPRAAQRLANLGIETVQDLLFHLPMRYQDRTRVVPMGSLRPGDEAVIEGAVDLAEIKFGRKRMLLVRISDGTGALTLRFFHFNANQQAGFARGVRLRCYGEVRPGAVTLEMIHPEYRRVEAGAIEEVEEHLTPIYPSTEGMHQLTLRALTDQALERLAQAGDAGLHDWLPPELLKQFKLSSIAAAIRYVHRPPPEASVESLEAGRHPAQQRLVFEELLAHHLSLRQLRYAAKAQRAPVLTGAGALHNTFLASLPFALTAAQRRVVAEIEADLCRDHPMLRLVQGDVGSGKTVVAALAALQAIEAGAQVAVMAPTELLAEQHYRNFQSWLAPLGIEVAWLSGKIKGKAREAALGALASGAAPIAIGTHALFQEDVRFARLGLVIVDEQHRFGVHQRLALRDKGKQGELRPHQLTMTATPIPRTLAMTLYADLDASIIDELPPGRTPVQTVVIPDNRRPEIVERVRQACAQGRQAYWVCTLIEESETLQCQAAADSAAQLAEALPELRVGLVHGRLKPREKEAVMAAFKARELDLLVATTVIEVGVDVPNASLMIIENAERLGLAQLHQLRGRVGRGATQSSCVLLYHGPLSEQARARLGVLRDTTDGFEIARRDLELRGPGEVLGTRQTGLLSLRIADLLRDQDQLPAVERAAERLLTEYPDHAPPLIRRWLGDAGRYGEV